MHIYMMPKIIMSQIAWYAISNDFNRWNIKMIIHGDNFCCISTPWLITIYTSYTFNANGVKTGVLQMSIQHVFFSTSTYFDLVWLNFLLDLTKNVGKSWDFLYLSFSILLLKFLTLPLTVPVCLRKFPTSSDFIWRK